MKRLRGAVAVITGAGSGLGRALALELAGRGTDLALCDRDVDGLAQTRALVGRMARVTTSATDVADPAAMTAFRDLVERDFGRVSILINNAGVALYGTASETSLEDLAWIFGINFWGAVVGTRLFLPLLHREPEANLVTISSVFGIVAPPMQAGYAATKFAIRGYMESLRHELAPTSVRVTIVHPGGIRTRIARDARRGEGADGERHARDTKGFEASLRLAPERAARTIVDAVERDRPRVLVGRDAFFLDLVQRFFPAQYMKVIGKVVDPKGRFR